MWTDTHHTHAEQSHLDADGSSGRRSSIRRSAFFAVTTATGAFAALVGSPLAQAIIMRDGGVCDPSRHMGC